MTMKNTRRDFLKKTALMAASAMPIVAGMSTITTRAFASTLTEANDFNFVFFRVQGGMDSGLGLHPWTGSFSQHAPEDLYLTYQDSEVMRNISGTQISLGPSAHSLAPFVNNMAVVRGMYMGGNDLGHPFAIQHMSSGRASEIAPHMTAYFGSKLSDPSRFVVTNTAIQRGTVESFPVILTQALKKMGNINDFQTSSSLDLYQNSDLALNRYLNLLKQKDKMVKFSEILNNQKRSGGEIQDETVALASLAAGLARVVQIDLIDQTHDLDSHSSHVSHKGYQAMRWERIAAFLKGLTDNNLMQKTLVVVMTEFNRSPGRNFNDGTDHNYTDNAVALFGRNINGGKVIGDHKLYTRAQNFSDSIWAGSFLNYQTGAVADVGGVVKLQASETVNLPKDVDLIRPTDLWATVANSISPDIVKNLAPESRQIPGLFKR
ncbi:MAG: DUF1501 domain-containing protein [Bdellovibrio sp.]|nr:DUF1501 domain-containing protein [Bdellovibrio sp.]